MPLWIGVEDHLDEIFAAAEVALSAVQENRHG
jgi:hypothetical protein